MNKLESFDICSVEIGREIHQGVDYRIAIFRNRKLNHQERCQIVDVLYELKEIDVRNVYYLKDDDCSITMFCNNYYYGEV